MSAWILALMLLVPAGQGPKKLEVPDDIKETWFRYTQQGVVDVHGLQLGPFSAG